MFRHACPECGVDLETAKGNDGFELHTCPECSTRWTVCPDCGNLADMDENWNHEQGVCDECESNVGDEDIRIFILPEDVKNMDTFLNKIFGEDNERQD